MESTKSIKINIALSLHQQFESAANALKARGVKISFIEFSDFLNQLLTTEHIDEFIDMHTPIEHKIKEALLDQSKREAIEKILQAKKK